MTLAAFCALRGHGKTLEISNTRRQELCAVVCPLWETCIPGLKEIVSANSVFPPMRAHVADRRNSAHDGQKLRVRMLLKVAVFLWIALTVSIHAQVKTTVSIQPPR